jgi:hypothetical protein
VSNNNNNDDNSIQLIYLSARQKPAKANYSQALNNSTG